MNIEEYSRKIEEIVSDNEYKPLRPEDMAELIGVPAEDSATFRELVREMVKAGDISFTKRGKIISSAAVGVIHGVFRGTSKGFGFVTPDTDQDYHSSRKEDIFIPAKKTFFALDGDRVVVRILDRGDGYFSREKRGGKDHFDNSKFKRGKNGKLYPIHKEKDDSSSKKDKGPEGEIIRISERKLEKTNVIGIYYEIFEKRGKRYYKVGWVEPDSKKLPYSVFVNVEEAEGKGVKIGDKVEVRVTRFPSEKHDLSGEILTNFGNATSKSANYAAILAENGIETEFDQEVLAEAEASSQREITLDGRRDLRDMVIFTIDSADAKDLDDAISLEKISVNGGVGYRLGVHIADVSEYVREGSAIDKSAMSRGTSVYFTDKVVPMLPKSLSNGACSLDGGVDRYALSAFMTLDGDGSLIETELCETVIRSCVRGVYSEVNDVLKKGTTSEFAEKYKPVLSVLGEMHELYRILKKRSEDRGAVELDTEEAVILLDSSGAPIDIRARERGDGERMIEQFMLCANEGVATFLTNLSLPCVYRTHEPPSPEKLESFIAFAVGLGLDVRPLRTKKLFPSAFASMLSQGRRAGLSSVLSNVMLRTMMKAKYSPRPESHFGLAIDLYCHFTSPIRRYPDLAVHRIVKAMLRGAAVGEKLTRLTSFAGEAAAFSSENELKALAAEREIDDLYKTIYMLDKVGEEFDAVISSVTSFGLFVQLENTIEGFVPIETLDGRFTFDDRNFILSYGRTSYRLGQSLRIRVVSADVSARKINMEIVDE
ncbi:MAG: ribonuclease R [Clostridia bacterium]|nr:ribonuclease R [Clostridia bacterium]